MFTNWVKPNTTDIGNSVCNCDYGTTDFNFFFFLLGLFFTTHTHNLKQPPIIVEYSGGYLVLIMSLVGKIQAFLLIEQMINRSLGKQAICRIVHFWMHFSKASIKYNSRD